MALQVINILSRNGQTAVVVSDGNQENMIDVGTAIRNMNKIQSLKCTCLDKIYKGNVIKEYILGNFITRNKMQLTHDLVKNLLYSKVISVDNLKIASDGKLISFTPENMKMSTRNKVNEIARHENKVTVKPIIKEENKGTKAKDYVKMGALLYKDTVICLIMKDIVGRQIKFNGRTIEPSSWTIGDLTETLEMIVDYNDNNEVELFNKLGYGECPYKDADKSLDILKRGTEALRIACSKINVDSNIQYLYRGLHAYEFNKRFGERLTDIKQLAGKVFDYTNDFASFTTDIEIAKEFTNGSACFADETPDSEAEYIEDLEGYYGIGAIIRVVNNRNLKGLDIQKAIESNLPGESEILAYNYKFQITKLLGVQDYTREGYGTTKVAICEAIIIK